MAESSEDFLASMRGLIRSEMVDLNTSIDGIVVDYADGLATVRPIGNKVIDEESQPFPLIYRVPIRWPSFVGGNAGIKGPVTQGDKVQIIFGQQARDGSDDARRFDLTDAYAIIASNEISGGGANNSDMIMWFGSASIRITASGQIVITAPAGIDYVAPTNTYNGTQTTQGLITGAGGFVIGGGTGATATITGNVDINGTVTNNGKNIGSTHTHGGVQPGGGTSGAVT